ncbi:MAG: phage terminase large subunit, partial [Patescibacteria group bacterium]
MSKIFKFKRADTGEVIRQWKFNPSQEKFWNSKKRFVLFSGGFGCGKSMLLILKAIVLSQKYNGNYILMGRKTYPELRDALIKDFFNLCPAYLIDQWLKAETRVIFKNKSEIIFRHLDTVAESEIRSMNLGAAFIDQAEDIGEDVFLGLQGRLRREGVGDIDRRIYLSCNPKLTWLYKKFKREPGEDYDLIEASTLENAANLSPVYIDNLMKYPASYRRQYVEGVWDESLFSDRIVFAREYVERLMKFIREPIKVREGLEIFSEYKPGHRYQMGVDAAEGIEAGDEAAISIVDLEDEEEVASWSG